jgi:class 3 adenylate cyclase/tetratricopeptide (TPR) repeat protein
MKCPQCQFDNPPGMKFCGQCGAKLAPVCPQCGTENPPGFKFCGECGSSLAAPPKPAAEEPRPEEPQRPAPVLQSYTPSHLAGQILQTKAALEGERKQVTVLFCDLVGSTALADRLGPETMHLLLNRFFEMALGEVHRYEGTINQFLGDGFMALFGAPITHEDHARRAVLAALGLLKRLDEQRDEVMAVHGVEIRVRMGINTGWVVVGGIGDQLRKDYTAIGDTTNLAARLQQIAEPGTVLVSEATMRFLQGSVELRALEPVQVKGKEAPIRSFQVLGAGSRHSEQAILSGTDLSPFVGRNREVALLDELRERAAAGEGQILGIAGEAGSGKSRLLYELRRRLWDQDVLFLAGRCLSYGSGMPYLPLLYMLRNEWGIGDADPPDVVMDKIRASLARAGIQPEESLPYLLTLLAIREGTERLAGLSAQALQTRTFGILRQMILNARRGQLIVLELEDLHWIDQTSEEFLGYLVEGVAAARMLLLVTYRSGYRPRWLEKSYATQISLPRLTERESRQIVDAVLRRSTLADPLLETVLTKAEGNPFFLEELTRSVLESPDVSVPDTIQGVLLARIDRLPEEHKRLLQTASVLGREFPLALLTSVWEGEGSLGPLLTDLKRWEFLYEQPTAEEPLYFFKHALTQEAIYQTLLASRRQALHAAAGRAFEQLYEGHLEDVYDRLAYHWSAADEPGKAVLYLVRFAEKAAAGYAHTEAARALREALTHAARLPEEERDRRTLEAVLQLAASLLPLAQLPETLEILERHGGAVERLGDPALAGRFFFWLAHTHSYLGNQEEAAQNARRSIEEARSSADAGTEGKAWYVLSRDAFWAGQFSEGIRSGLQAVALLERSEDRWWQGQAYWVAGFEHYVLGRFEEALQDMAKAHVIYEALEDPRLDPSWSTGYFHASLGDAEAGIEACRGGLARAQDPLNTAAALGFLGYAYLQKGDLGLAVETLEDSVRRVEATGMRQLQGWFSVFLAEAYLSLGRSEEAAALAQRALDVTREARFWYGIGLAQQTLGRVAHAQGRWAEAEEHLRQAVEGFRSLQVPFEVARTRLDLASLAHARGDTAEASAQLAEARRAFVELRVPIHVQKAEGIARELAADDRDARPAAQASMS